MIGDRGRFNSCLALQAGLHATGASAASAFAKDSAELEEVGKRVHTKAEIERKIAEFDNMQVDEEGTSAEPSVATDNGNDSGEDTNLHFSSFTPEAPVTKPRRKDVPGADKQKRRRVLQATPAPSPGEQAAAEAPQPGSASGPGASGKILPAVPVFPNFALPDDTRSEKVKKAHDTYQNKVESFSDLLIWEGKLKSRNFKTLQSTLENVANVFLSEGDDATAQEVLDFPEKQQQKFDLFQKLKKTPKESIKNLTHDDMKILEKIWPNLLAKIFVSLATTILKDAEDALVEHG